MSSQNGHIPMVTVRGLYLLCANSNQVRGDRQRTAPPSAPTQTLLAWSSTQKQSKAWQRRSARCSQARGCIPSTQREKNNCVGDILEGAGILEAHHQETHLRPMEIHLQGTFCSSAKPGKWNVVAFPLDQPARQNIGL